MRSLRFFATLAVAFIVPTSVHAADPPIVFQTQPIGRILADFRATIQTIGGPDAAAEFNKALTRSFGEKGFDGLDLTRPIVGYLTIPTDLSETVLVVIVPVAGEKEFLDLYERLNGHAATPLKNGIYKLAQSNPELQTLCRVVNQLAYIATGKNPSAALEPAARIPVPKLLDPTEHSLATATLHFDRLPAGTPDKILALLTLWQKGNFPGMAGEEKLILSVVSKFFSHILGQSKDAKRAIVRLTLDVRNCDLSTELTLTPKPDSALEKSLANRKPSENQFGALITPDTVFGFKLRVPLLSDDVRTAVADGLNSPLNRAPLGAPPSVKAATSEFFKGLARTVKKSELDLVGVVRGPDKKGLFTAIGVLAYDNAVPLEKAFRKAFDEEASPELKKGAKWNVDQVGTINIHTFVLPNDAFIPLELSKPFGNDSLCAFAFAPNGIFVALGPDAVAAIKKALVAKPTAAPPFDLVLNAARLAKFAGSWGVEGENYIVRSLGIEDKLSSVLSLTAEGNMELKIRFVVNLKILGGLGFAVFSSAKSVK